MQPEAIIKECVDDRGIKITVLAKKVGMTTDALSKSLRGTRKLKSPEFISLCKELNLRVDDFTTISEKDSA